MITTTLAEGPEGETGLSPAEIKRILRLMAKYATELTECKRALATNFDVPAQRSINWFCACTGVSRIDYEKIVAVEHNWEYEAPDPRLLRRWAGY